LPLDARSAVMIWTRGYLARARCQPELWQDELDERVPALAPLDDTLLLLLQLMWLRSGPLFVFI
jgi:hypothetical protein